MADSSSLDYYRAREDRELALAQRSSNPKVAAIHRDMARRYAELIALASVSRYRRVVTVPGVGSA